MPDTYIEQQVENNVLLHAVQTQMFCRCGSILDVRRATLMTHLSGAEFAVCNACAVEHADEYREYSKSTWADSDARKDEVGLRVGGRAFSMEELEDMVFDRGDDVAICNGCGYEQEGLEPDYDGTCPSCGGRLQSVENWLLEMA